MPGLPPATVDALLDVLLPGGEGFPAASAIGLSRALPADDAVSGAIAQIAAALPGDFGKLDADERHAAMAAAEQARPATFQLLLNAAYSSYYTHLTVLAAIEAATGYPARPPQPAGYALPPFDASILDHVRSLPPSWRAAETDESLKRQS